jgi:pimeloyl-ACP methyl ester carboxylesterase
MESRSLRTPGANGIELHWLEWSREGVPMILLHGFGNEAHLWDDFAPCVAPYYRVLAWDARGHGDSSWDPERRYDPERMTDDLEAATRALGIERFVLIGFSMGGRVSTFFAERHPERLAGLVLVDIGPEVDPRGTLRIRMEVTEQRAPIFRSIEEYAEMLSLNYPAGQRSALLRMARYALRERRDGKYELKMDPALRDGMALRESEGGDAAEEERSSVQRQWDALAALSCPTLVVRGAASDILSPEVADRMVDEVLKQGRLAVVSRAAHSVMTDNPEGFNQAVCSFVLAE